MPKPANPAKWPGNIDEEASRWLARLDRENLSASEKAELVAWLQASNDHRRALAGRLTMWSDMDVLSELAHLEPRSEKTGWINNVWQAFRPNHAWPGRACLALSLVFLMSLLFFQSFVSGPKQVNLALATAVGKIDKEQLPDGSVVQLNTNSAAAISYTHDQRNVKLKSGEGMFDVSPDTQRPFVVYAGETRIRAVGTAFSVKMNNDQIQVLVTEGTVAFQSGDETQFISADGNATSETQALGNTATFSERGIEVEHLPPEQLERQLTWRTGMLEFRGETLEYVAQELQRYTDTRIEIVDDDIRQTQLGGYFKIGDIDGLASTLKLGFNIDAKRTGDKVIQLSRGKPD